MASVESHSVGNEPLGGLWRHRGSTYSHIKGTHSLRSISPKLNEAQPLYDRGISYPMVILGVIAGILLAAGLIPPYFEIWKRRGRVVGINWVFVSAQGF